MCACGKISKLGLLLTVSVLVLPIQGQLYSLRRYRPQRREEDTTLPVEIVRLATEVESLTAEWQDANDYADKVTEDFASRVQQYGVCKLKVSDKEYSSQSLRQLTFKDGLVVRVGNISRWPGKVVNFTEEDNAVVKFRVCLGNTTVFYDLKAENNDQLAAAILTFPTSYLEVSIAYNLANQKTGLASMKAISVSSPKTVFIPDTVIMTSVAYNTRQSMSASLFNDLAAWVDGPLTSLMDNVMQDHRFPLQIHRQRKSRPQVRALCCRPNRDQDTGKVVPLRGEARRERVKCCRRQRAGLSLKAGGMTAKEGKQEHVDLIPVWVRPLQYLDDITQLFGQRLQEYGVGNLPVLDKTYSVNKTRYNIHLLGNTTYTDGLVTDIRGVSRYYRHYIWYIKEDQAVIQYKIELSGVEVLYQLRADLKIANLVGSAELSFHENHIEVFLFCNLKTREVGVTSMKVNAVSSPTSSFGPDSDVMRALAYNAKLSMSSSLYSDLPVWIDKTLRGLLENVVEQIPFPLQFKRPGPKDKP